MVRSLVAGSTALLMAMQPLAAVAAPVGGTPGAGAVSIQQNGSTTTVTQFGNQAVINWKSFSIGSGETVQFVQPNALAVALNRVTGIDPSVILGSLLSNGRIFLVNPNGVLFGKGSTVDVGGLAVSTLSLSDSDFLAGKYNFSQDVNKNLSFIVNQGTIKAANGGYVVLVAPLVDNQGTIVANLGQVAIGTGTAHPSISTRRAWSMSRCCRHPQRPGNVTLPSCASSSVLSQIVNTKGIIRRPGAEERRRQRDLEQRIGRGGQRRQHCSQRRGGTERRRHRHHLDASHRADFWQHALRQWRRRMLQRRAHCRFISRHCGFSEGRGR